MLDVHGCHIDIAASGAQKWLVSPWGAGFTFVRQELIPQLEPGFVSWMGVRGSDDFSKLADYDLTWRDDARKYEFITLPFQEFAGLNASLELMLELGLEAIALHTGELAQQIVTWAEARGVETITPRDAAMRAGIVALRPNGAEKKSASLHEAGVAHSLREGAIRLSPYFFNTPEEIEKALKLLSS
jgi:selenocysteine lyase/cysteine desulfurase